MPGSSNVGRLDARQREEATRFYADAAMKLIHDAMCKGYKDVARLKKVMQL